MGSSELLKDVAIYSEWISKALRASGYGADFTVSSVREVERFMADSTFQGEARPGGLLVEDTGGRLFALGVYVGEVIRRSAGGNWKADDGDPSGEINISLELPDGTTIWPVRKVIKRFRGGAEESLVAYVASVR
ncbi:hypothetical protein AB0I00_09660 [Streptomyces sp. NPDC050803]|uniref:hypothetical protein n=1 Tax=unclassified Streptomyces TaxID=2593676 RepID=UPI003437ACE6